tara:strand:- start:2692 stop:2910 length:219 start_codon:yes stop_codon:yes gene_type:complete
VHPKNWFILFEVKLIVLFPEIIVPELSKPIVESTVITSVPIAADSIAFVNPGTINAFSKLELSSYPTKSSSL